MLLQLVKSSSAHVFREPTALPTGVYLGWAQVRNGDAAAQVLPMAMSVGWNQFFKNEKKTIVRGGRERWDNEAHVNCAGDSRDSRV